MGCVAWDEVLTIFLLIIDILGKGLIVIGGSVAYAFQYYEIYKQKDASGFSLVVCLTLLVANILRILFWVGKRFDWPLLAQSITTILTVILLLEISVRMKRKCTEKNKRVSIWTGHLINHFWDWTDLTSYFFVIIIFAAFFSMLTYIFINSMIYVESVGMAALFTEAALGIPQVYQNCKRRSTAGLSVKMVSAWLLGDCYKILYVIITASPYQFLLCGGIQMSTDVLILIQIWIYGTKSESTAVQMPWYMNENENRSLRNKKIVVKCTTNGEKQSPRILQMRISNNG